MATDNVIRDMMSAKTVTKSKDESLVPDWEIRVLIIFFDLIKKLKLVTFTRMIKIKACKSTQSLFPCKPAKILFLK